MSKKEGFPIAGVVASVAILTGGAAALYDLDIRSRTTVMEEFQKNIPPRTLVLFNRYQERLETYQNTIGHPLKSSSTLSERYDSTIMEPTNGTERVVHIDPPGLELLKSIVDREETEFLEEKRQMTPDGTNDTDLRNYERAARVIEKDYDELQTILVEGESSSNI